MEPRHCHPFAGRRRAAVAGALAVALGFLGACSAADEQSAQEHLAALIDHHFPGELTILDSTTSWPGGVPEVHTRLRVEDVPDAVVVVDNSAAAGEHDLRAAYHRGLEEAAEVRALTGALDLCDHPLLAVESITLNQDGARNIHAWIATEITTATLDADLDAVAACLDSWASTRAGDPDLSTPEGSLRLTMVAAASGEASVPAERLIEEVTPQEWPMVARLGAPALRTGLESAGTLYDVRLAVAEEPGAPVITPLAPRWPDADRHGHLDRVTEEVTAWLADHDLDYVVVIPRIDGPFIDGSLERFRAVQVLCATPATPGCAAHGEELEVTIDVTTWQISEVTRQPSP